MPSLSFKKEFAPGILAMLDKQYAKRTGVEPKGTTIRATRKRPIRKGDKLFLFSGLRTKYCKKLGETICKKTEEIIITEDESIIKILREISVSITVNGISLGETEAQKIATCDGFEDWSQMVTWFRKNHGLPFSGQIIHFTNTYNRKYFCNKKVKDHGFSLQLETTQKTININQEDVERARADRYINELATKHNYGIQIINPLFK